MILKQIITKILGNKITASSVSCMTVNADIIGVNNQYGHFEIGDKIGKTISIDTGKQILRFCGGILIEVVDK